MDPKERPPQSIPIEVEMRRSYLDYAMSVIIGRALPDVRDGLPIPSRAVRDVRRGAEPRQAAPQVGARGRAGARALPPPRRCSGLRHAGADGAGFLASLPADRRPGKLRIDRRRPPGGHALHRGPDGAHRRGDARRHREGDRRLRPELRRLRRSRPSFPRRCRTSWSTARRGSPWGWPPTSRRTTSERSSTDSCC